MCINHVINKSNNKNIWLPKISLQASEEWVNLGNPFQRTMQQKGIPTQINKQYLYTENSMQGLN